MKEDEVKRKKRIKKHLKERMGRDPQDHEIVNAETDALVLAQLLSDRVDDFEDRLAKLENI